MNDIILAQSNELTMSSREVAELTGKKHSHVFRDARKMLDELEEEHQEYIQIWTHPQNKQSYEEYALPKDLTITLISGYNLKMRHAITKRWIELESQYKPQTPVLPQNYLEALEQLVEKEKQLIEQAPKVAFVDNCVERGQLMTATQVAQKHKLSAVKLNKFLDELGGVYSKNVKRSRVFVQPFIDKGYGEMKQTELGYSQALFTASGEQFINQMLITEGAI